MFPTGIFPTADSLERRLFFSTTAKGWTVLRVLTLASGTVTSPRISLWKVTVPPRMLTSLPASCSPSLKVMVSTGSAYACPAQKKSRMHNKRLVVNLPRLPLPLAGSTIDKEIGCIGVRRGLLLDMIF